MKLNFYDGREKFRVQKVKTKGKNLEIDQINLVIEVADVVIEVDHLVIEVADVVIEVDHLVIEVVDVVIEVETQTKPKQKLCRQIQKF